MAFFKIFMVGSSHAPMVEVAANDIGEVAEMAKCARFLECEIVDPVEGTLCRALIPMSRIQMIAEARQ